MYADSTCQDSAMKVQKAYPTLKVNPLERQHPSNLRYTSQGVLVSTAQKNTRDSRKTAPHWESGSPRCRPCLVASVQESHYPVGLKYLTLSVNSVGLCLWFCTSVFSNGTSILKLNLIERLERG